MGLGLGNSTFEYGDAVMNCRDLPWDSMHHRHDSVTIAIVMELLAFEVSHDYKVYGLFADLLPTAALEAGQEL